jgi:DNA-binding CsgD family transcriptional regulator
MTNAPTDEEDLPVSQPVTGLPSKHLILDWVTRESKARLIVNSALNLLWANATGYGLLENKTLLKCANRHVRAASPKLQNKIESAIRSTSAQSLIYLGQNENEGSSCLIRIERLREDGGHKYFGFEIVQQVPDPNHWLAPLERQFGLTPKQSQILMQMISGKSTEEAAGAMAISVETARTHVRDIYVKLGVGSREELFARVRPFYL